MKDRSYYNGSDFFNASMSYIEMLLSLLPKEDVDDVKKECIMVIYNDYLKNANDTIVAENAHLSSLFSERLLSESMSGSDSAMRFAKSIYDLFLCPSIFFSNYRNDELFNAIKCAVKVYLGVFEEYEEVENNVYSYGTRGNLRG